VGLGRPLVTVPMPLSGRVDQAAAVGRAAVAGDFANVPANLVIDAQLLTWQNPLEAAQEDVPAGFPKVKVRAATVVDVLGPVALPSVNNPVPIQAGKGNTLRLPALQESPLGFRT